MIAFLLGLIVGASVGLIVFALISAGGRSGT